MKKIHIQEYFIVQKGIHIKMSQNYGSILALFDIL
jgi:hypothetical protein